MSKDNFRHEMVRILQLKMSQPLTDDTRLDELDSMGVTEVCLALEEMLGVELEFGQVRAMKTFGTLRERVLNETEGQVEL